MKHPSQLPTPRYEGSFSVGRGPIKVLAILFVAFSPSRKPGVQSHVSRGGPLRGKAGVKIEVVAEAVKVYTA